VRAKGKRGRIRKSTGLPAIAGTREAAEELRRQAEAEAINELVWGIHPSVPIEIGADKFLSRPRARPLNAIDITRLQEITRQFRGRHINQINNVEWGAFVDRRMNGRAAATRERYIDLIMAFLAWAQRSPRQWLSELPVFERDQKARQRLQRRARRVGELRPDLIALLIQHAAPHLQGQMAIMWSTGARVSSLLYGCRLCDYLAAEGREQITFHDTKNGDRVIATVHPWAAATMRDYLAWRGRLEDREAPLFLTDRGNSYADNGKAAGGQTKTAFKGMKRRAATALRRTMLIEAIGLRRQGQSEMARLVWRQMRTDVELLVQLTPHWFRHLLATNLLASGDLRSTMEQGGWRDVRSVMGYAHDVPERRRALVAALAAPVGHALATPAPRLTVATIWPRAAAPANNPQ
jgi:site-specific recombinase XerD